MEWYELRDKVLEDETLYSELLNEYGREYLDSETNDGIYTLDSANVMMACGNDALDIIDRAMNGSSHSGSKFNTGDDYFYMDAYGNMVSLNGKDLHAYMDGHIDKDSFASWCAENGYVDEDMFSDEE